MYPPAGLRVDDRARSGRRRRGELLSPRRRSFSFRRSAHVSIRTTLPGASPEEVESLVSQPIEEVVNTVEGIEELRSISGQGTSFVIATFNLDRDIDSAAQDVRDRVATVLNRLPHDIDPPVISKFDNDDCADSDHRVSGDRSLRELTEFADKIVKVQLERSAGVGEVRVVGGLDRAINVWIDADRLAAYQIPITAVRDAIQRQNADIPGGNVTGRRSGRSPAHDGTHRRAARRSTISSSRR